MSLTITLRNYPAKGRRTVIVPVAGTKTYALRTYNGHSRTNYPDKPVCQAEMLAVLIEAGEEEFVKDLLCEEDFGYVEKHYFSSKSFAHPAHLRA